MNNSLTDAAQRSVHDVHELIHTVFAGAPDTATTTIDTLMPAFAADFSMVTTTGAIVRREQVEHMFRQAAGGRPGLRIEISDITPVWQESTSIAVRYKETHHLDGASTTRCAVAILDCAESAVRWRYLHETALNP